MGGGRLDTEEINRREEDAAVQLVSSLSKKDDDGRFSPVLYY